MSIKVIYEDGVFRPLEDVKGLRSGKILNINVAKPLEGDEFFGMWKNRKDMKDSVSYVRKLRSKRRY